MPPTKRRYGLGKLLQSVVDVVVPVVFDVVPVSLATVDVIVPAKDRKLSLKISEISSVVDEAVTASKGGMINQFSAR